VIENLPSSRYFWRQKMKSFLNVGLPLMSSLNSMRLEGEKCLPSKTDLNISTILIVYPSMTLKLFKSSNFSECYK
jgi:hypothetical protein